MASAEISDSTTTTRPIATRYGFHVIRLDRRIAGEVPPFEAIAGEIAAGLEARAERQALAQYAAMLLDQAEVRGIEFKTTP